MASRRWWCGGVRSAGHRLRSHLAVTDQADRRGPRSGDRRSGDRLSGDGAHGHRRGRRCGVLHVGDQGFRDSVDRATPGRRTASPRRRSATSCTAVPAAGGLSARTAATRPRPPRPTNRPPAAHRAVPTVPAVVRAVMTTNDGTIGLRLDNGKAPCGQQLCQPGQQGYFDGTPCHRLTAAPELAVLQCGDPTGTGTGGPGYRFANEYPTNQYRPFDPSLKRALNYPRARWRWPMPARTPTASSSSSTATPAATHLHGVRAGRRHRPGDGRQDRGRRHQRGPEDGRPGKPVTITAIRLE